MKSIVSFVVFLLMTTAGFAQQDTATKYLNKSWEVCNADSAFIAVKTFKVGNLFHSNQYWVKGNILKSEEQFLDEAGKKPHGTSKYYNENGTLRSTSVDENGISKYADFFYENGKKMGNIDYTIKGTKQTGWDENGNEIPGFIVEKEAIFPGGPKGWQTYLEENLNAGVASSRNAKPGIYTVKLQFIVNKNGSVANVQAIEVPRSCPKCGKEAIRVVKSGPNWEPAIQYNKAVIYQCIQSISFAVIEE